MYKALIVDDHAVIRVAGKLLLKDENFGVVAETDNGSEAVQLACDHQPDLILLDIAIPKLDGLEVLARISALEVPTKVLVLTSQSPEFYAMRCMKAGAAGYISKGDGLNELIKGIRAVMSGYTYFPNLSANSVRRSDVEVTERELVRRLSDREMIILRQLALGMSNKEIAESMQISSKTVSTYKIRLIDKLNVKSLVYLADFARRNGLI
ncbi:response regulator [Pseudomonas plecoglossicida]|uniref:DNA-binding response regulator n=1 Tax=Pseudomonas plecoglossicida TaxID=70775 RepID=A0AAD0VSZ0_PSEDL|nr:response regulator transcription factor [Pseudomonas plecoglossicida]AXM95565.1 DNA-binding response regulator [Pseudomonas plecoglossicida]EPB94372.1 LuxR family transcriptional regulator [Pseudomonas plecoglossicida NB2011]QLB56313.1 response regulator transcription factor [Pseudomonas plecoglossicida]GLR37927.1 DNA-binding response regulator [Pseudomonas plecoglossicida]